MFQNVMNISIRCVDMSSLGLGKIKTKFPRHLETLKLSDNPKFFHVSLHIFHLRYIPNVKHLYIQNISLENDEFDRVTLNMNGTNLKTLIVDRNIITEIYPGIRQSMPELETVSVAENQLLSTTDIVSELLTLPHLKYLNLNRQNHKTVILA